MRSTRRTLSPVVTLLSPSPAASRRAQELLGSIFGLGDVSLDQHVIHNNDVLNAKFRSSLGALNWDSVASRCPKSGSLIHWLSIENATNDQGSFSLLGVSRMETKDANHPIEESRALMASNFPSSVLSLKLRNFLKRPITSDTLLRRHQGLPVLDLPQGEASTSKSNISEGGKDLAKGSFLKEVAFTVYDDALYEDGSTVLAQLSQSALSRPVTGVYEWPTNGSRVCLRPLPAAETDLKGSAKPLVLTFHCGSLEQAMEQQSANNNISSQTQFTLSKIGYTGKGNGQLRIQAAASSNNVNPLNGLDVRWCERTKPTSMFTEAQESLLASSLPELQSANVLKASGKDQPGEDDARIGSSDCWVEVRTMVQNPRGFAPSRKSRVASAPPSYPE